MTLKVFTLKAYLFHVLFEQKIVCECVVTRHTVPILLAKDHLHILKKTCYMQALVVRELDER